MNESHLLFTALAAAALVTPLACGGNDYPNHPPGGNGGFDPGSTVPTGNGTSTGYGNTGGTGGAGGAGGSVPMCDDSLKRCDHLFSYQGNGNETSVAVRGDWQDPTSWSSSGAMTKNGTVWSTTVPLPYNKEVQYKFVIDDSSWITDPANPSTIDNNGNINSLLAPTTCTEFTCATATGLDEWRDAVMYFVFVDRFFDGSPGNNGTPTPGVQKPADYQGGDYAGVTQKIESGYFNDLGVNALWITVPMDNTEQSGTAVDPNDSHIYSGYHGYWPKNLGETEERFGTMMELKGLVDAAHLKGIKIIIDYAMNHVHVTSPVYQQHQNDGWFWPNQNPNDSSKDCVCGHGCSWDTAGERERCWFTSYLPDFNFQNTAARDFSVSNAIWWLQQTGADGLRLDAVKHIEMSWIEALRSRVATEIEPTTMKHVYMVGETYTGDRSFIKNYVSPARLDGQFDFPLRDQILRAALIKSAKMSDLDSFMASNDGYYGASAIMSTFLGNHDVPRIINYAADSPWNDPWYSGNKNAWTNQPGLPSGTAAFERLSVAFGVILTSPGIPLIYYGDEVGMPGGGDPDNRRMMQWAGYSQGQQILLDRMKKLGAARANHAGIRRGSRTTLSVGDDTWAYRMSNGDDTVYVVLNRADSAQQVSGLPSGALHDEIGGGSFNGPTISAPARSVLVLTP